MYCISSMSWTSTLSSVHTVSSCSLRRSNKTDMWLLEKRGRETSRNPTPNPRLFGFFLKPGHKDLLKVFERVSTRLTSDMGNRINAAHKLISKLDLLIVLQVLENVIPRHNWCSASWSYRSDFPTSLIYLTWYGYGLVWRFSRAQAPFLRTKPFQGALSITKEREVPLGLQLLLGCYQLPRRMARSTHLRHSRFRDLNLTPSRSYVVSYVMSCIFRNALHARKAWMMKSCRSLSVFHR